MSNANLLTNMMLEILDYCSNKVDLDMLKIYILDFNSMYKKCTIQE